MTKKKSKWGQRARRPYAYKISFDNNGKREQYIGCVITEDACPYEMSREELTPNDEDIVKLLNEGATITDRVVIKRFENTDEGRIEAKDYVEGLNEFMLMV